MPFPSRLAQTAPATSAAPLPPAPPAGPAAPALNFWVSINGATPVLMPEAAARALPAATPAMPESQAGGWSTLAALLGAVPAAASAAPAPMGRAAFGSKGAAPAQVAQSVGTPKGMFAGVENADVIRRGNNINAGDYICKVCSAEYKQGRQKNYVITELEVIVSSYDATAFPACNREGSRMTNFVQMNDNFASNMKEILLAVSGIDPATGKGRDPDDTVTQQECEAYVSPEQPFAGAMVYIEAREVPTRVGGLFTRVSWWPCPVLADGTPDQAGLAKIR